MCLAPSIVLSKDRSGEIDMQLQSDRAMPDGSPANVDGSKNPTISQREPNKESNRILPVNATLLC